MTETRTLVAEYVTHNPGVHFNELVRSLDLAPGQVQHHIRRLIADDAIQRREFYGRTHYFAPGFDAWERGVLALVRRDTARAILGHVLEHGEARPGDVADEIGVARSTLEWHLDHLVERDIVHKRRDLHNHVTLELTHPERTAHLLESVSPSLPDPFVAQFDRRVSAVIEG
ncbi:winged helix-turn-helix transcriptional regulator [Haloferax namakaokahaiae]|uniref:Winged helix-turn-helix transcriptional regulator n=1 Tax=Haloferax namakaokahaiae TaxID=1748331 RepID=A0ABD5ZIB8_9EURY